MQYLLFYDKQAVCIKKNLEKIRQTEKYLCSYSTNVKNLYIPTIL
jgi:hypothetical protein